MPARRRADSTPDLFASLPPPARPSDAPGLPVPREKYKADAPASRPRHLLPQDLAGALKQLQDAEVDALLAAVTHEVKRRGRPAPTAQRAYPKANATSRSRREAVAERGAPPLTTDKLNAVRAAFKAGIRPAAIARQFGILQADVKSALAAEKPSR